MSVAAIENGGLPRRLANDAKLKPEQKLTLAEQYLRADDKTREGLVHKWGRGRVRRALLEFARHEHELEYLALRMREDI